MNVLRMHGIGDVRLHEETAPVPQEGEALIDVTALGICGSDLHWFMEAGIGDAQLEHPLVLGHEFSGVIRSGSDAGMRVAVEPCVSCGMCRMCEAGHPNLCLNHRFAGHGAQDGALREQMCWPQRLMFPIPDEISDVEGAMLEPLGVAIHSADLGKLRVGARVGVFGCGPIGLMIAQLARLMGARQVVATDALPHRVEAAQKNGATEVLLAEAGAEREAVRDATGGEGVDGAFEVAGHNDAVETAVDAVRPGGTVILVGIPDDDRTGFSASLARRKGLTFKLCRRMKHTYPRAIQLVKEGRVDVASLVTHEFSLAQSEQAFQTAAKRDGLKTVILPNG